LPQEDFCAYRAFVVDVGVNPGMKEVRESLGIFQLIDQLENIVDTLLAG
jgi:hypothetical protein